MRYNTLVERGRRNPAHVVVDADDAAEAAFTAWREVQTDERRSVRPLVRYDARKNVWYVEGCLVQVHC